MVIKSPSRSIWSNKSFRVTSYILVFGLIVSLFYYGHDSDSIVVAEQKNTNDNSSALLTNKPSIDQVAATDLAADLASIADLSVSSNVANQAISLNAKNELAQTGDDSISKPQIIQPTTAVTRGVTSYKAKTGDTAESVAKQFNLNKETIKWSNAMESDALEPGRKVIIPPVDGVVSTAKSGDTVKSLAQKYKTEPERIILYNDIDAKAKIDPGVKVVIPGGKVDSSVDLPASSEATQSSSSLSGSVVNTKAILAGGNRYDYGYCTWYVFNRRAELGKPINGLWGNASSWASLASSDGFLVDNKPSIGAVLQTPYAAGGYGHVAVVESVNPNGSLLVSEMNYQGWGVKSSRTISASEAASYSYIH